VTRTTHVLLALVLAGGAAHAGDAPASTPLAALPYSPSLDPTSLDRSVDPCVDFYAYSCGGWIAKNPIPADQARWNVYAKLYDENQRFLWGLLQSAAEKRPGRTANEQKIGDYFASCMDEAAVEKAGVEPLRAELAQVDTLQMPGLAAALARLHPVLDSTLLFNFGADQDPGDASRVIAIASAGGLGLPDRDYYLTDDAKSKEIREKYVAHVAATFRLLGRGEKDAAAAAATVMRIETALAKASLTNVDKRDPKKVYNLTKRADLQKLTPSFAWDAYLAGMGRKDLTELNVTEPAFFTGLESLLKDEPLAAWQDYFRWHLARGRAPYLSDAFVRENFSFYGTTLRGVKEMRPRWKRCVAGVDRDLGEALGQVFVEKAFPAPVKQATLDMVVQVERAMEGRIRELPWMGGETKARALEKLKAMRNKIGYPDRWRDYGSLSIDRASYLDNLRRSFAFETNRVLAKIGQPVDRGEWGMTPPTVNAYYNATMNDMNFPAGVLLPPLFDLKIDAAPNYGNTGATIGHELTHGFDDEGRQFDAAGNLKDWWTEADAQEFEKRTACVVQQYAGYTVIDDIKINSRLTLGEDVADLGGTIIAYLAWKEATRGQGLKPMDGLTPDQRFFVGMAQWACGDERPESLRVHAATDPHSPEKYRINGVVANIPEFKQAFSCKVGQPMVKDPPCRIW
jgi:endothelin-converting enzyme/putative endopeptidase